MNNVEYWRGRFAILEDAAHKQSDMYLQSLEGLYRDATFSVQKEIEAWYGRFANNNQISVSDAKKLLNKGQLAEFKWTVKQYIKAAEKGNLSLDWIQKLENASTRYHISRLEAIQMQIQQQMELLYGNRVDELDHLFRDMISNGYTYGVFELQKGLGIGWDFVALNQKKLDTLLTKPWTTDKRTFRDRCWLNKDMLVDAVNKELIQGMLRGDAPAKMITAIQKQFGTDRYKARRLVHTETTFFNAVARNQMYHDFDVELIEIVETLDARTCSICQPLDGTVIPVSQYEPGVTVPPYHPNCRGTTCPHYDDMEGERVARTANGDVYYVPSDMKYEEWKKAFVDGGAKDGLTLATANAIIKLTEVEQWALNEYISSGSYKINELLREGAALTESEKEWVDNLDSALKKMPCFHGDLVRFVEINDAENIKSYLRQFDSGFYTTTQYLSTAKGGVYNDDANFQIYIQNATKGRDISAINVSEKEVLYERNSKFRVVQKVKKDNIYYILLEEV